MKKILNLIITISFIGILAFAGELNIGISGNNRGLLTPCGCKVPSGGWARISTTKAEMKDPKLMIGAGNHFFHHTPMPKEDQIFEQQKAVFQAKMFKELGYDVINIGQFDLCYGIKVLKSMQEAYSLPFISANVQDKDGDPVFPPYKIFEHDGASIMFVGITDLSDAFNYTIADPLKTLTQLYENGTFEKADLVILLADASAKFLSGFVKEYEGIDMIIAAREHTYTELPIHYRKTALIQMGSQGKHFGIIDLHFNNDIDSWKDMTPLRFQTRSFQVAVNENVNHKSKYKRQLRRAKKHYKQVSVENPNHFGLEMTLLDESVKDSLEVRKPVEAYTPYP